MSPPRMHHRHLTGVTVITLSGEVDLAGAPRLHHFIGEARQAPADHLVSDMTDVSFMDSSGLTGGTAGSAHIRFTATAS
ncbi:STAS domain-containing protein [Nonomuraea sp. B12E4]|uniref:STAS domain-containing protein n=1 Tax=Nonomuraea sp. B12E4 TaxID=3153564 RepID=UPI00325D35F7